MLQDDKVGTYAGFDRKAFTARSGGKLKAVEHLKVQPAALFRIVIVDAAWCAWCLS